MLQDAALSAFVEEVCQADAQIISPDCRKKFDAAALKAIEERYPRASIEDVKRVCQSGQEDCRQLASIELLFLRSHNAAVLAQARAATDKIVEEAEKEATINQRARSYRAQQASQERARWQAIGGAMQGMAKGFSDAQAQQQSRQTTEGASTPQAEVRVVSRRCTSDFACGFGHACVKPTGSVEGECARVINERGLPEPGFRPRSDSYGRGTRQCYSSYECPARFNCELGQCIKH
jgi:hypothetical protein